MECFPMTMSTAIYWNIANAIFNCDSLIQGGK